MPQAAESQRGSGAAQGQFHRLRPEGEDRRFRLDPHQVAGIGPPPDHAARHVVAPQSQGLDEGHQGEFGADRVTAWPGQHHEMRVHRAHVGAAAQGEQRGMGAVPPVVAADGRRCRERGPVEGTPQAGGPGHGLRPDGGAAGGREPVDPAVELRDGRTAIAHQTGGFRQPVPHGLERGARATPEQQADGGHADGSTRVARGPGERLRLRRISGIAAERSADLVVGDTEPDGAGAPDGQARQFRLGVLEGGLPRGRVDRRDGSHQRMHEPVSHGQRWRGRATPQCAR